MTLRLLTAVAVLVASMLSGLLDLLLRHRERLRQLQPDAMETRLLHFLVEERRRTVNERTRQSNRLTDCLKLYFPQVLRWFDGVDTALVGDLLERWPSLEELQRAHPGTLRKFLQKHNCRSAERNQERIDGIYEAVSATNDAAVREAGALTVRGLVSLLRTLRDHIAELEQRIEQLVASHPEAELFSSLPGAGAALVPRLIVAFGTRRERYNTAFEVQCYSSITPVKTASGKPVGSISAELARSFCGRPFTSMPCTRSGNRSGPRRIISISGRTSTSRIRQR